MQPRPSNISLQVRKSDVPVEIEDKLLKKNVKMSRGVNKDRHSMQPPGADHRIQIDKIFLSEPKTNQSDPPPILFLICRILERGRPRSELLGRNINKEPLGRSINKVLMRSVIQGVCCAGLPLFTCHICLCPNKREPEPAS